MKKNDGSINDESLLNYYLHYFEIHSNQRMQMINYYITIEIVLIGALFTLLGLETRFLLAEYTVSIAITMISVFFYGLDYRTKLLIHWCEDCIKNIEKRYEEIYSEDFFLMNKIEYLTNQQKIRITYAVIFRIQYGIIGIFGIICFIMINKQII